MRIIYIVRDPIARIISHLRFFAQHGRVSADLDAALAASDTYVFRSMYATQLRAWYEEFDVGQVLVIRFEDYIADRVRTLGAVTSFIGVRPHHIAPDGARRHNATDEVRPPRFLVLKKILRSDAYRRHVRELLPTTLRGAAKAIFLRRAILADVKPLSSDTIDRLREMLSPEVEELASLTDLAHPVWEGWR